MALTDEEKARVLEMLDLLEEEKKINILRSFDSWFKRTRAKRESDPPPPPNNKQGNKTSS
jgi:hypothetical protein